MDLGSLLIIFALLILVAWYVARPILEKGGISVTDRSRFESELQAEKDQILMNLQELDMDHAMGKITTEQYQRRRPVLLTRGATILKELDRLAGVKIAVPIQGDETRDLERKKIEAQIEEEILRRRKRASVDGGGYCPQCGNKVHSGDLYCTSCGSKVFVEEF
jgi:hypothetical protein